jgi:hypothetical protein
MTGHDDAAPGQIGWPPDADPGYQRRVWMAQRIGWAIGAAIIAAAALGLFGFGPLSWSTAGTPGAFWIEYDRFSRVTAPSKLVVRFDRTVLSGNRLRLFLGEDYLKALKLEPALPPVAESSAAPGGVVLTFDTLPEDGILQVTLPVSFTTIGRVRAEIGPLDGSRLRFQHVVYP